MPETITQLADKVATALTKLQSAHQIYVQRSNAYLEGSKTAKTNLKNLFAEFDEGLSGRLKKVGTLKPEQRGKACDELTVTLNKYHKSCADQLQGSESVDAGYGATLFSLIASECAKDLKKVLTYVADVKKAPQDKEKLKVVVNAGDGWSKSKKLKQARFDRELSEKDAAMRKDLEQANKGVGEVAAACDTATIDKFKQIDAVQGTERKARAVKLVPVAAKMDKKAAELKSKSEGGDLMDESLNLSTAATKLAQLVAETAK